MYCKKLEILIISQVLISLFAIGPLTGVALENGSDCKASWLDAEGVYSSNSFYELFAKQISSRTASINAYSCVKNAREIDRIKDLLIVDVRTSEEFEAGYIPGSINLPAYQLKTKNSFKSQPILIVDKGAQYLENLSLCDSLPQLGFREIYLLEGGYETWVKNQPGKDSQKFLKTISASEFISLADKNAWWVLDFSHRDNTFPERVIQFDMADFSHEAGLLIEEKLHIFSRQNGIDPMLLIMDEEGMSYAEILKSIPVRVLAQSYLLGDGLSGFDRELSRQKLILENTRVTTSGRDFRCN